LALDGEEIGDYEEEKAAPAIEEDVLTLEDVRKSLHLLHEFFVTHHVRSISRGDGIIPRKAYAYRRFGRRRI
jgi:hypothetical protein